LVYLLEDMVSLAALRSTTESRLEYSFPSRGSESDFRKAFSLDLESCK